MRSGSITRVTVQINSAQKFEEPHAVLWELSKILVDHVQCRLEDGFEDRRYLRSEEGLMWMSPEQLCDSQNTRLTPRRDVMVAITFKTSASLAVGTLRL